MTRAGMPNPESTPPLADHDPLSELARVRGIELRHEDGFDRVVEPDPECLRLILSALGCPASSPDEIVHSLREEKTRARSRRIEPVVVLWTEGPTRLALGPGVEDGAQVRLRIRAEGGGGPDLDVTGRAKDGGIELPRRPTPGYYRVSLEADSRGTNRRYDPPANGEQESSTSSLLVVAPPRVFGATTKGGPAPREWAAFLPLHALRSERNRGVGDLTDLKHLLDWTESMGGRAVGTLPLMSTLLDEPFDPSPYAPASREFWNELYLDPTLLPEWEGADELRLEYHSSTATEERQRLRASHLVEYQEAFRLQKRLLARLSEIWIARGGLEEPSFRRFLARPFEVERFARFQATLEARGEPWPSWPAEWRRDGIPDSAYQDRDLHRHLYSQFRFAEQLQGIGSREGGEGAGLYLDLPLAAHPMGYDTWAAPGLFAEGAVLGAPPDAFHDEGQNWGLPPIHPREARDRGYQHLRRVLGRLMPPARYLRIDHVMGLHRLYWVPRGESATRGAYVRYPAEELYAILSLESHRHRTVVVGEDLGTVPAEVRSAMDRRGLRRMYVVPFELASDDEGSGLKPVPHGSVASLDTHDTLPFMALWKDEHFRQALRRSFDGEDDGPLKVMRRTLEWLGAGPAGLVVVNLENLWLEASPQNRPGTDDPRNWRQKARLGLEEFTARTEVRTTLEALTRSRRRRARSTEIRSDPVPPPIPERRSTIVADDSPDPRLTPDDLHLFNEGSHTRLYRKLGAHPYPVPEGPGTHFAVWAPNAEAVSVVGDFNGWTPGRNSLSPQEHSGIWSGHVSGVGVGERYKYHIRSSQRGYTVLKADPFGFQHETPPATASLVADLKYDWGDARWMESRGRRSQQDTPLSVYEVHLGSWRRDPENPDRLRSYRELAPELASYAREMGFTHIQFLPLMEHPFYGSWGYQTTGYFAPTSRHGSPRDFMYLIDHLHQEGVGVFLDWVPSHFPSDEHGLGYFDGTHLYEHADPRQGFHPDWDSLIFNYGREEVRSFLLSSAFFWLDRYHVDGIRVDAVASMLYLDYSRNEGEWIPNEYGGRENLGAIRFLRRLNEEVYGAFPDVHTIAEESTAWPMVSRPTYLGGLGFGMKWDMGWMHDTLQYLGRDPVHRPHHHDEITFRALYAFNENFMLPLSHDEVVHGKGSLLARMPGDLWQKRANLRLLFTLQFLQPGKKLLFMGAELGQWSEWSHDGNLEWERLQEDAHRGIQHLVMELNRVYREQAALHRSDFDPEGFRWITADDHSQSTLAFLRRAPGDPESSPLAAVFNFTPVPRKNYRIGVPGGGTWTPILNSDAGRFGGSDAGNQEPVEAAPIPSHGHYHSLVLSLPPLGALVLQLSRSEEDPGRGQVVTEPEDPESPPASEEEAS